jgi:hypothetical protein
VLQVLSIPFEGRFLFNLRFRWDGFLALYYWLNYLGCIPFVPPNLLFRSNLNQYYNINYQLCGKTNHKRILFLKKLTSQNLHRLPEKLHPKQGFFRAGVPESDDFSLCKR